MTSADMAIAYRAARAVSRNVERSEFNDLYSDAVYAVWRASLAYDGSGRREPFLYERGVRGVVDGLRSRYGRAGSVRSAGNYNTLLVERQDSPDCRPVDLEIGVDYLIEDLAKGDERLTYILRGLAEDKNKEEIATELGVHASRVSQLLRKVKERVELGLAA